MTMSTPPTSRKTYGSGKTMPPNAAETPRVTGKEAGTAPAGKTPTHEQICARARAIWQSKGCPTDQDQQNWREAEAQLRAECQRG